MHTHHMDTFIKFTFPLAEGAERDMLLAHLAEEGFDGFEEQEDALMAYIPQSARQGLPAGLLDSLPVGWTEEAIAPQNWNAVWESSFEPVVVDDFCAVRAGFHAPVGGVSYDIVITPRMSFGTGHHATTWSMIAGMKDIDFAGKAVLDFGAGTGVLAILAAKMGAARVVAVEHEEWTVENAVENCAVNNVAAVQVIAGSLEDAPAADTGYDVILANINRHILLEYMEQMAAQLAKGGKLLLSGILAADEDIINTSSMTAGLQQTGRRERNGWLMLTYEKRLYGSDC